MISRRSFLVGSAAALPLARTDTRTAELLYDAPARAPMQLCMHQNTSRGAGFRGSLEGWARAGIQNIELNDSMLDGFLESDTLTGARRLIQDLGLTPVSGAVVVQDLWLPGPARERSLETWRRRCEQFAALGSPRIYSPSLTRRDMTPADYDATPPSIREAGEIAGEHGLTAMIEFTRGSTHLSTLSTTLDMIRRADHPSVAPMLDFFHFWSGLSKFEDLDLLEPGELEHAHFQDLLDTPRELIDNNARLIPGDGIAPVVRILQKLAEKGYEGALSVELFRPEYVRGDPFEVGNEIRTKCERVMAEAGVS